MEREEQLRLARQLLESGVLSEESANAIKADFPELAESEDERIRKEIYGFLNRVLKDKNVLLLVADRIGDDIPNMIPSWIAYLEKHKEQKPAEWSEEDTEMMIRVFVAYDALRSYIEDNEISSEKDKNYQIKMLEGEVCWLKNWFKSILPYPHWKPSEEQMEELGKAKDIYMKSSSGIASLYYDLKTKLM